MKNGMFFSIQKSFSKCFAIDLSEKSIKGFSIGLGPHLKLFAILKSRPRWHSAFTFDHSQHPWNARICIFLLSSRFLSPPFTLREVLLTFRAGNLFKRLRKKTVRFSFAFITRLSPVLR